jgi:hypothetical protein
MTDIHILEGDLMDDFGWGEGVKTHRPHLQQVPVMVGRNKRRFPHLMDATDYERKHNVREVPVVSPIVKRIAQHNNRTNIRMGSTHPEMVPHNLTPIQEGLNYFHEKLPLGFLKRRRNF